MVRDSPREHPPASVVADAASEAVGRPVAAVRSIAEGLNAVYRVEFGDGETPRSAVLKAATLAADPEFLPEPRLFSLLADTGVPVPEPLAVVDGSESPFDAAFCLTGYCEGRHVTDVHTLSPNGHERLVREAGHHLAGVHDLAIEGHAVTPNGPYGDLRLYGGDPETPLVVGPVDGADVADGDAATTSHHDWAERFRVVVDRVTDGLVGESYTSGGIDRFADVAPVVRSVVADAPVPGDPPVATVHGDYRPANLVFAPDDDAEPLVRAVLDFGTPETGDGLLDLALAEDALVGVPVGGTPQADRLTTTLRRSYAEHRRGGRAVEAELGVGGDGADTRAGARYRTYLLVARAKRMGAFGYFAQFAREDDEEAVARRFRGSVESLVAGLDVS